MYKSAYMVVFRGVTSFVGNYDNLADLRYDYPSSTFECWAEGGRLFVRMLTPDEARLKRL